MYVPKYFKEEEFKRLTPSCSMAQMDENLLMLLDELREAVGMPFVLTSAYRTPLWDISKGRTGKGAHTKGMGVDIQITNPTFARIVLERALRMPFRGIGIAKNFIHLDVMPREYTPIIWGY